MITKIIDVSTLRSLMLSDSVKTKSRHVYIVTKISLLNDHVQGSTKYNVLN